MITERGFYGTPSALGKQFLLDNDPACGYHCSTKVTIRRHNMRPRIARHGYGDALLRQNVRLAKNLAAGQLVASALCGLRNLTVNFGFSIALGDLLYLDGRWYVTHGGLLRLARSNRCSAIHVRVVRELCDPAAGRWVFRATVYTS